MPVNGPALAKAQTAVTFKVAAAFALNQTEKLVYIGKTFTIKATQDGKPAILMVNTQTYEGHKMGNGVHAVVLIGEDASGNGIFIDPTSGRVNYANGSATAGGYLLVG